MAAILLLLILALAVPQDALARTEARYELRMPCAIFGNDLYSSRSTQTLFHQQKLDTVDFEHYDMAFPAFADGIILGPSIGPLSADGISLGTGASANVLPFGLVNLSFPSIQEDVLQSISASQTGFFSSNYNYRAETDYGNVPLSPVYAGSVSQAISPALWGISPLYPEQYDTIAMSNKLQAQQAAAAEANKAANQTTANQTAANKTSGGANETSNTGESSGTPVNTINRNSTDMAQAPAPTTVITGMNFFRPKNASSKPSDTPLFYASYFDMADKSSPAVPSPGIGTLSSNGVGGFGASLTGPIEPVPQANLTGAPESNKSVNKTGNITGNESWAKVSNKTTGNNTLSKAGAPEEVAFRPTETVPYGLTYANFNFDATTQQINAMPFMDRMWRNSHRGGTMGKAYAGDTSYPIWIDPYERPNDVSMIDEHWYNLQCALNMTVPGTQILPRYWSLML